MQFFTPVVLGVPAPSTQGSRRLNIRYKDEDKKNQFVHTISSTAVTDRVVSAIMESYQQEDGSILIPEVLQPFCGFDKIEAGS